MFSSQSAELPLDAPCRVVKSVVSDRLDNRFLVGSCRLPRRLANGLTTPNYLYAVRFHAELNDLGIDAVMEHPTGPMASMACSPSDATLIATSTQLENNATLWRLPASVTQETGGIPYDPEEYDENGGQSQSAVGMAPKASMDALTTLATESGKPVTDIAWRQADVLDDVSSSNTTGDLLTVDTLRNVQMWHVEYEKSCLVRSFDKPNSEAANNIPTLELPPRIAWDPHSSHAAALTLGQGKVQIFDWRSDQSIPSGTVDHFTAHRLSAQVLALDYNPNKPYVLATSGTDGLIKFWDLRAGGSARKQQPLLTCRGGHSHWVETVQYNPFHDQLVLSTGTDCMVNLWRISTISSAPLLAEQTTVSGGGSGSDKDDQRVASFEHTKACYGAAWGAADAWVYATIGYEGKVLLHHVPSKEKYKILL